MENAVKDFILSFTSILYEALPFIVLGAVIAGFLEELVPQEALAKVIPSNRTVAVGSCALLGLVFPMCECGIVVVMRRLLKKGLPLSCCIAYMLAGPIINPIVIASTYVAFVQHEAGPLIIGLRIVLGFVVAFATAMVVERLTRRVGNRALLLPSVVPPEAPPLPRAKPEEPSPAGGLSLAVVGEPPPPAPPAAEPPRSLMQRVNNITETALHDFVDITVFLIIGALLAALVQQQLSPDRVGALSAGFPVVSILTMMGLGFVLCLCSEADAFVAASFTTLQPAAKLAFLVLGPMLDIKLLVMYTRVFRPRLILTIVPCVVVLVFVLCLGLQVVWPYLAALTAPRPTVLPAP